MNRKLESGVAECIYTPMGDNGLEGFFLNNSYRYELMTMDKDGKPYYRVYLDDDYYETCGPLVFKRYFKKTETKRLIGEGVAA